MNSRISLPTFHVYMVLGSTHGVVPLFANNALSNNALSNNALSNNALSNNALSNNALSNNALSNNALSNNALSSNAGLCKNAGPNHDPFWKNFVASYSMNKTGLQFFGGIPYAAPPVGNLRWRPPRRVASWHDIRKLHRIRASLLATIQ